MSLQTINSFGYNIPRIVANTLLGVPDDTFAVPVSLQTIPFFAIKNGDLWRWNTVTFIWEQVTSGGAVTTIYTGDGNLAGNRSVGLNGNTLNLNEGGNSFLLLNPTTNTEQALLQAINLTGAGNSSFLDNQTSDLQASFNLSVIFNNVESASISALANTSGSTLLYVADQHTFSGATRLNDLAGNGSGFVAVDNDGDLSFGTPSGSSGYTIVNVSTTPHNPAQTSGEHILLVDATAAGGPVTINLPTAVGNTAKFTIKKIDSGSDIVTIDGSGGQTIDGDLTKEIEFQWTSMTIVSDNLNWLII
jgi:hypothetical protein